MSNNVTLSIIVPVYKVEQYLRRCIDSILNQTYTDFELILVDDGSPDNCPVICDEYAKKDNRISALHKQNAGLSSARNSALDIANGKYVAFVDSDDWISKDAYEHLVYLIEKHNADVVSASYVFTNGEAVDFSNDYTETIVEGSEEILKFYLKQDRIHEKNDYPVWTKIYKKELFDEIRFPDGKIYEDNITNFLIFSKCKKYVKSSKEVYAYFQRQQSTTKTQLTENHFALIDVSKTMFNISRGYGEELQNLTSRKIAMSYFSILTMYVRYGTNVNFSKIKECVNEYKKIKSVFLKSEKSIIVHFVSFLICTNIKLFRKLYILGKRK